MREYQEGYYLTLEEIGTILALGGKTSFFGLRQYEGVNLTQKDVWTVCCRLMQEGAMTQIDGKYRLRRDLHQVMLPVFTAHTAWVLTPGSDQYSQVIYYLGDGGTTMVELMSYGGYSLTSVDPEALIERIREDIGLRFYDSRLPDPDSEVTAPSPDASWEALRQDATFLLEKLDAVTGVRLGWMRGQEVELEPWLQWTEKEAVCCKTMTVEHLEEALRQL